MDGHSALDASQSKARRLVLLVLKYGNTAVLQDQGRNVHWIKKRNTKLYSLGLYLKSSQKNILAVHKTTRVSGTKCIEKYSSIVEKVEKDKEKTEENSPDV